MSTQTAHTPGPWTIGTEDTPWTCGDSRVAVEEGVEFGHTEILFPIYNGDGEPLAYLPWEPLAGAERQTELRANARLIAKAPELLAVLARLVEILDEHEREATGSDDATTRDLDTYDALREVLTEERKLLTEIDG